MNYFHMEGISVKYTAPKLIAVSGKVINTIPAGSGTTRQF